MNIELYKKEKETDKKVLYLRTLISRVLLSIILVLVVVILIKIRPEYQSVIEEKLFTDSLEFTKINNLFNDSLGSVVPVVKPTESLVFSASEIKKYQYEKDGDHVKIKVDKTSPISALNGGIVVFKGEKDGLGSTIIVQGNDGIDIWYSNIENSNVNLYDYINKDTILGSSLDEYIYLSLYKDGKAYSYEEYIK